MRPTPGPHRKPHALLASLGLGSPTSFPEHGGPKGVSGMLRDKAVFQWIFKGKGPASSRHRCQGSGATNRRDVLEKLLGNRAPGARMTTDSGGEARRQKAAARRGRRPRRPRSEAGSSQALRRHPTPPPPPPAAPHPTCSASWSLLFALVFSLQSLFTGDL